MSDLWWIVRSLWGSWELPRRGENSIAKGRASEVRPALGFIGGQKKRSDFYSRSYCCDYQSKELVTKYLLAMFLIVEVCFFGGLVHLVLHAIENVAKLVHLFEKLGVFAKKTIGNESMAFLHEFLSGIVLFKIG